jgi:DNA recombination protein RmuC
VAHLFLHLLSLFVVGVIGLAIGVAAALAWSRSQLNSAVHTATSAAESTFSTQLAVARDQAARIPQLEAETARLREQLQDTSSRLAASEAQSTEALKSATEKLQLLEDAKQRLSDQFHALSAEALRKNNQSFLELAKETLATYQESAKGDLEKRQQAITEVVNPVRESLTKVDAQIQELEKNRVGAYESLQAQVRSMIETQQQLRAETGNLVKALRAPNVRGRWGEVQLRRVVEMAGMVEHCDFAEQQTVTDDTGSLLRPDLTVRLPGDKIIVVDSKAPISAYLDALDAPDDLTRTELLLRHARHVRDHIEALSRKAYWEQFNPTPEFVVLFLPGEMFFSAALERDPELIEFGAEKRVILATPTTLIALLKAIYFGWRQQKLTRNAQEISELGKTLYARLCTMGGHIQKLGKSLGSSVESYNKAVASLETRVLTKARQFNDLEIEAPDIAIETLEQVDHLPRQLSAPELTSGPEAELIRTLDAGTVDDLK